MAFDKRTSEGRPSITEDRPSTREFRLSENGQKIKVNNFSEMRKMMRELAL